jgi:mannosidase alpha-like ER degradation enhancer 1
MYMPYNLTTPPTAAWRANHRGEDLFCPVYTPQTMGGLPVGIEGRDDYDYARALVFGSGEEGVAIEEPSARALWSEEGTCALPHVPNYSFEIVLAPAGAGADFALPAHDASPGLGKVYQTAEGDWVITDIDGLRLGVRWRMDGFGYDVTNSELCTPPYRSGSANSHSRPTPRAVRPARHHCGRADGRIPARCAARGRL